VTAYSDEDDLVEAPPPRPRGRIKRRLATLARALSTGATFFWIMFALGGGFEHLTSDTLTLSVLLTAASAGIILSWWNMPGAIVLYVAAGLALGAFAGYEARRNDWLIALLFGGPYIVSGLLMLPATDRGDWTGRP